MILLGKILIGIGIALVIASWGYAALAANDAGDPGVERPFGSFFHSLGLDQSHFSEHGRRYRERAIVLGAGGFGLGIVGMLLWAAAAS